MNISDMKEAKPSTPFYYHVKAAFYGRPGVVQHYDGVFATEYPVRSNPALNEIRQKCAKYMDPPVPEGREAEVLIESLTFLGEYR